MHLMMLVWLSLSLVALQAVIVSSSFPAQNTQSKIGAYFNLDLYLPKYLANSHGAGDQVVFLVPEAASQFAPQIKSQLEMHEGGYALSMSIRT